MSSRNVRTGCVLSLLVVVGLCAGSLALLSVGLESGWTGFLAGFLMAAVPLPFYLAIAKLVDRFEPEPPWLLATAVFWGASTAILLAMIFNGIGEGIFAALLGQQQAAVMTPLFAAPFVEEIAKGFALLMLFLWKRDEFDNVTDGIIYAAMVGLGFAMMENVQYYAKAVTTGGGGQAMGVFFVRGVLGPFCHPLFTSMTGIGFGVAQETNKKFVKVIAPVLGLAGAMFLHGLWNLSTNLGLAFFATYLFFMVPMFFGVIIVAIFSLRRESIMIRQQLEVVVADHVLSHDDVLVVTSVRRRIAASSQAFFSRGIGACIDRRRFHAVASELAFHSWRCSRFEVEDAEVIRAELVERVRTARAKLGLPLEIQPPAPQLVARLTLEIPLPDTIRTRPLPDTIRTTTLADTVITRIRDTVRTRPLRDTVRTRPLPESAYNTNPVPDPDRTIPDTVRVPRVPDAD
ncbi:MAG TPA: PrsW family intramembrane metalloprotease [Thermoanaerobaculia bacterium]|jgi:RsiW-degrading membrane proteinase PrsW (M82 family)|nr:PrsW family intramembrane metalloprotease [Thermoanaerobaculia bacterium]